MEIEIAKIVVTHQSFDVTSDECKFIQSVEEQKDGSALVRLKVEHVDGNTIPLRWHGESGEIELVGKEWTTLLQ